MKYSIATVLSIMGAASMFSLDANAIIIGGAVTSSSPAGGVFTPLTVPLANPFGPANSVGNDTYQDQNLYAFNESQNAVVGAGGLTVNVTPTAAPLPFNVLAPGLIAANTIVASHYVFFDPDNGSQSGYVDFDSAILGLVTQTTDLAASDYLANTGVNYLNPSARGLEGNTDRAYVLTAQPNRVYVEWSASTPGDYIRVLTAYSPGAVPDVGSTLGMLGCAAAVLGCLRRRRL